MAFVKGQIVLSGNERAALRSFFNLYDLEHARPEASASRSAGDFGPVIAAIERTTAAVQLLPSRQRVDWTNQDTANVETALQERSDIRKESQI